MTDTRRAAPDTSRAGPAAGTLMYLAYGDGPHVDEAVFSLLTAARFEPFDGGRVRYLVVTDRPEAFAPLAGVVVQRVDQAKLDAWLGGGDYVHRRKQVAMIETLEDWGGKLAFVDSDTCFQRSPAHLFDRVGPGRSCLHLMENFARLHYDADGLRMGDALDAHPFVWRDGARAAVTGDAEMWNSGVTGLDHADIEVLREGLRLSDHLWTHGRINTTEQFAVGLAARRLTFVSTSGDVVFHYWHPALKQAFRARTATALPEIMALPAPERPRAAFEARARATPLQRLKQGAKLGLRQVGWPVRGTLRSA